MNQDRNVNMTECSTSNQRLVGAVEFGDLEE